MADILTVDTSLAEFLPSTLVPPLVQRPETPPGHRRIRREFLQSVKTGKDTDVVKYIANPAVAGLEKPDVVRACLYSCSRDYDLPI